MSQSNNKPVALVLGAAVATGTLVAGSLFSMQAMANGYMQDGSAVVDLLITDMERGGPVSSQMQQTFGLSRKAQGAY